MLFVRPDENDKSFDGQLVHRDALSELVRVVSARAPLDTLCVVASPRPIEEEWRLFMASGRVIACSQYRFRRSSAVVPGAPASVIAFAEDLARTWSPHPIFVMDVGRVGDTYCVVEIGSASCAGLYACDLRALVRGIRDALDSQR